MRLTEEQRQRLSKNLVNGDYVTISNKLQKEGKTMSANGIGRFVRGEREDSRYAADIYKHGLTIIKERLSGIAELENQVDELVAMAAA